MPGVVVIGSANIDFSVRVPQLPRAGETVLGEGLTISHGGKGANQAVAAHRAGADVQFIAKLGRDDLGDRLARRLEGEGLRTDGLLRDPAQPTGAALILVEASGENLIAVAPGSNACLAPADLERFPAAWGPGGVLLLQLEIPLETVAAGLRLGRARGLTTVLNPAPARRLPPEVLDLADVLTPNAAEVAALSGVEVRGPEGAAAAGRSLLGQGCIALVVTLGAAGAVVVRRQGVTPVPPFPVRAVDATAAGDAFSGTLAAALAEGQPLERAAVLASAAGAIAATRRGAQEALPRRAEIEALASTRLAERS